MAKKIVVVVMLSSDDDTEKPESYVSLQIEAYSSLNALEKIKTWVSEQVTCAQLKSMQGLGEING